MKNVLFLQSWYSHQTSNWYPWLEVELKKQGYKTNFPDIAEFRSDKPDLAIILNEIKLLDCIDEDTIIIGHSLGCLVAMRIAEKQPFHQMILVSGWDFYDLIEEHALFWKTNINHTSIKRNVQHIAVIHSDNDPYTNLEQATGMAKRLSGKFILIPGGGHLTSQEGYTTLPEILTCLE